MNVYCLGVIDVVSAIQFLQVQRIQSQKLIPFVLFIRIFFGFSNIISNDYTVQEASFKTLTKSVM